MMYPLLDDSLIKKDKSEDEALLLSESRLIIFKYSVLASIYSILFGVTSILIFLPDTADYFLTQEVFTVYAIAIVAAAMIFTAWYTSVETAKNLLNSEEYILMGIGYFFRIWLAGFAGQFFSFFILNEATNFFIINLFSLFLSFLFGIMIAFIAGPIVLYLSKDKIEKTFEID